MKIAICDDEPQMVVQIEKLVKQNIPDASVLKYTDGGALLEDLQAESPEVILLDIDMPKITGMDVASYVKEHQLATLIIFVTAHDELVFDSFQYHPFAFVRKNFLEAELSIVLDDCRYQVEQNEDKTKKRFVFRSGGEEVSLLQSTILYFEAAGNYLNLKVLPEGAAGEKETKLYKIRATMGAIQESMEKEGFIRIHKGFLVNREYVKVIRTEELVLDTGESLPLGKLYAADAKAAILKYMREC